jgi:hypothetical protein
MVNKFVILFIFIAFLVNIGESVYPSNTPFEDPHIQADQKTPDQPTKINSERGSTARTIIMPIETASLNVTRKIMGKSKDGSLFRSEIFEVIVKLTCLEKDGLENIEIWEIPDEDLIIENCTYPIATSSIKNMLEYEAFDKSYLHETDIKDYDDIIYIKRLLTNNSSKLYPIPIKNSFIDCYKIYLHIFDYLAQDTKELLKRPDSRDDLGALKNNLIRDFNKIIENNSNDTLNSSILKEYCCMDLNRNNVYSYNLNSIYSLAFNDNRLIKRRLLEQIFPSMIDDLSYYKLHEDLQINMTSNIITFKVNELYQGETIVFKYYLYPKKLGISEIRSIIRTKRSLREEITPIKIIERGERFNVDYWSESKELISEDVNRFSYYVEYLGGNDEQNKFPIKFIAPKECVLGNNVKYKSNGVWADSIKNIQLINGKEPTSKNIDLGDINFFKGKIEEIAINVTYLKPGLRLTPPTITIGNFTKDNFQADLSVYSETNMKSRINYEWISILVLIITSLISFASLLLSGASLYEILLSKRMIKISEEQVKEISKDRAKLEDLIKINSELIKMLKEGKDSSDKLLKNNTDTITILTEIIRQNKN